MKQIICTICKQKEAAYFRPYSGEKLCRKCFITSVENKVRATIAKYRMLEYDDTVAVAVSGDKLSSGLLYILTKIEKNYPKSSVHAVSVDEGIRGYRDKTLKVASKLCGKLGVEHHVVSFQELYDYTQDEIVNHIRKDGKKRLMPCECCGALRRKALRTIAQDLGVQKIATAHSLDEEIQTPLLHILRGDPLRISVESPFLGNVHTRLVQSIRPFCESLNREITLYVYLRKIEIQNAPCPYASNILRNNIHSFLDEMEFKHPSTKFVTFGAIKRIKPVIQKITEKVELGECISCGEPSIGKTCSVCHVLRQLK
ncbi:MAG: TIGR00269 family protein [Candidatus Bathyarchaeota archaeon]|jgi:uncharacterized protein (TIGR00269 family)